MKRIFVSAAVFCAVTGFAQTTPAKLSFPKGQKLEVVTEVKKTNSMELMGQAMETTVSSTLTEMFDIENADANGATIEHKVKRLVANISGGMTGEQSFDSEKESDMKGDMGKLFEKGIKNKYKMNVDAMGKVTEVKADDDNPNGKKDEEAEGMSAMMSSQMGVNLGLPKVGNNFSLKVLPAREVKTGETWADSSNKEGVKTTTNYKVNNITGNDVVLDYTEQVDVNTTQQIMGQEASIKSADTTVGQIVVDKTTGLLKSKTATVDTKGTVEAQGMTIPVSGKTSISVSVKPASL